MRSSEELLSNYGLRKTILEKTVEAVQDSEETLTVEDIKKDEKNDKVTIWLFQHLKRVD